MPLPNLDYLQADPNRLLPWLENNLLLSGNIQNVAPPGLAWARIGVPALALIGGVMRVPLAVNDSGRPIDVYSVRSDGASAADSVRAYVCNYQANDVRHVDLGSGADYCFTVTLNGCTFGIGPAAADGSRRVSHANSGGRTAQQQTQTWGEHGVPVNSTTISMFEPAVYRKLSSTKSLNATVFGIRTGRSWRFYFQLYQSVGAGLFKMIDVVPIVHT
jgi:hypothetical protein